MGADASSTISLSTISIGLLSGGLGWIALNLYGQPLLKYLEVKKAICQSLIFYGLIVKTPDEDATSMQRGGTSCNLDDEQKRHNNRVDERCRMNLQQAGELVAAFNGLPKPFQFLLSRRGEDVIKAQRMLTGMSNANGMYPHDYQHLKSYRNELKKLLKLKYDQSF